MSLRDEILAINDLAVEKVYIKQWKRDVYIRGMTADERDQFEAEMFDIKGKDVKLNRESTRAKLVAKTVCDESGTRIFTDADVKEIGKKSGTAIDKLFSIAQKLSGIGAGDLEELTKNSETGQPD